MLELVYEPKGFSQGSETYTVSYETSLAKANCDLIVDKANLTLFKNT